jgi:hypothetical protein
MSAANQQRVTQAVERSGAMSSVLIFAANWKKWYEVLRYRKGFGLFDSMRFGLWLARLNSNYTPTGAQDEVQVSV